MSTNQINRIYIQDSINIENTGMNVLLFCNRQAVSKKLYSIVDNILNLTNDADSSASLFINTGDLKYYEYKFVLTNENVTISGSDIFKNTIPPITNQNCMIFVNGKLITNNDYMIQNSKITITSQFGTEQGSTIIILLSREIEYLGNITRTALLQDNKYILNIYKYNSDRYIFFKNNELITKDEIAIIDTDTISFNIKLENSDIISYYKLPENTTNYFFSAMPGYLTYGPTDDYDRKIPDIFDTRIIFSKPVKLAIDDVRVGMIIAEENNIGKAMIISNNFETNIAECISLTTFSKSYCNQNEFYIQVPEATSILKYISEYDLQKTLFPELLTSFQRVLLDETYDSIQRLKNIRNINKVNSEHIAKLVDFLGLKIDITDLSLEQKHNLLEELNNFHRIVGTRSSYNFYNTTTKNSRIIKLEQLFTPIKNSDDKNNPKKRYITFKTAEEEGAIYHKEYVYDTTDYGRVDEIANTSDNYRNSSPSVVRRSGTLQYPDNLPVLKSPRRVYYINEDGNSVYENIEIPLNLYTINPLAGPNKPTVDYGYITNVETDAFDYGSVAEAVPGKWIEWTDWERPKDWYPTNHVQLSSQIPPDISYNDFMEEFKKTFYDIASAVLYIHTIIEIYTFGGDEGSGSDSGSGGNLGPGGSSSNGAGYFKVNTFGGPVIETEEYSFTNDPEIQVAQDQGPSSDPKIPDYITSYNKLTDIITLQEYIGNKSNIVTPTEF